jgi:regulator of sirC expression with transglutaminase-like and TPR domain
MEPETADDFVDAAIHSLKQQHLAKAQVEALIAVAMLLGDWQFEADTVPAAPIAYGDYDER